MDYETISCALSGYIPDNMQKVKPASAKAKPQVRTEFVQTTSACEKPAESVSVPSKLSPRTCSRGRLSRLLQWAEGRAWDLRGKREVFLFVCGCLIQQQTDGTIDEAHHPLLEINRQLAEPMDAGEVEKIICELNKKAASGTDARSKWYLYRAETIAELLDMTADETRLFLSTSAACSVLPTLDFQSKLAETMRTERQRPGETPEEYRQRCYAIAGDYFREYRKAHPGRDHAARTAKRKRAAEAKKQQDEENAAECKRLRAEGLSIRSIAQTLGLSKSQVDRLLKT